MVVTGLSDSKILHIPGIGAEEDYIIPAKIYKPKQTKKRNPEDISFDVTFLDFVQFQKSMTRIGEDESRVRDWNLRHVMREKTFSHFFRHQTKDLSSAAKDLVHCFKLLGINLLYDCNSRNGISNTMTFTIQTKQLQGLICCAYGIFPAFIRQADYTLSGYLQKCFRISVSESFLQMYMMNTICENYNPDQEEKARLMTCFTREHTHS